jgi:hypothetical protein
VTKKYNQFIGKAGHLAMMSEFLIRGWNVGMPEVDIGDDIFVVHTHEDLFERVQVKTSQATFRNSGFTGRFVIPLRQLGNQAEPGIHYVFILRKENQWSKPVIIHQRILFDYFESRSLGTKVGDKLQLYIAFNTDQTVATCSGIDISRHISDYSDFPIIPH